MLVSVATLHLARRLTATSWARDDTASTRTTWTNQPTAASRESQVAEATSDTGGGAHCSLFSAFTTDPGEGAANCSSADLHWPPLSLRSSGWSSLQPSPKVWRRAKQHGTTECQCFPKKRPTFWWIDTFLSLVKVQELPLLLKNHRIVCHNMMACSVWNTHR